MLVGTTDIDQRSQNMGHIYPGMGLQLGYSICFSRDQYNHDPCIYTCSLSMTIKMPETPHGGAQIMVAFACVCFRVCGRQKPEHPNWSSVADDVIRWMGIGFWDIFLYLRGKQKQVSFQLPVCECHFAQ